MTNTLPLPRHIGRVLTYDRSFSHIQINLVYENLSVRGGVHAFVFNKEKQEER